MAATNQQQVRFVGIIGGPEELKTKLTQALGYNRKGSVVSAHIRIAVKREMSSGKAVVSAPREQGDVYPAAGFAKREGAAAWLVKCGEVDVSAQDQALFAKILSVKNEADIAGVVGQIKAELDGKTYAPFPKHPRVIGEVQSGEFKGTVEDVKKAFAVFGAINSAAIKPKFVSVAFESEDAVKAALDKKELTVGGVQLKLALPRATSKKQEDKKTERPEKPVKADEPSTAAYLKIESVPAGIDSKAIKDAFSKFGVNMADINKDKRHCILRFRDAAGAAAAQKEKIMVGGTELKAVPYAPSSSGRGKRGGGGKAAVSADNGKAAKPAEFTIAVEGADPAKCTDEQLKKTFGGFKGLTRVQRSAKQPDLVFVAYDNAESVQEVLGAKGVTAGTAQLTVREDKGRGGRSRGTKTTSAPKENGETPRVAADRVAVISGLPESLKPTAIMPVIRAVDEKVILQGVGENRKVYIAFSSVEARNAALAKELKVEGVVLTVAPKVENTRSRERGERRPRGSRGPRIEAGVFLRDVKQEQEEKVRNAIKPIGGDVTAIHFTETGCRVGLNSDKDVQAVLAGNIVVDGAKIAVEPLKQAKKN